MPKRNLLKLILLNLIFSLIISCGIPKDPQHSWEKAKEKELLVGVVINPPFTSVINEQYNGSEVDLIRNFASDNHLELKFVPDNESDLIKKLEDYKVSVVIGGFDKESIWKDKAGLSLPYDDMHVILLPKGENELLYHLESFIYKIKK